EEIVQEIFLQLTINPHKFNVSKGTARAWISHLAVHKSLDRHTYLTRRRFYDGTDLDLAKDALKGAEDLEGLIQGQTTRAQLRKALEELAPKQRITLEWFFFEECSLREISERLGDTHNNVRHHFYRGLEK